MLKYFCFTYIGVLFFCILFQIEYWPYSCFGVFKYAEHPVRMVVYRMELRNANGEEKPVYEMPYEVHDNSYFNDMVHMSEGEKDIDRVLREQLFYARRKANGKFDRLVLYRVTFRKSPNIKNYEIVREKIHELPL